MSRHNRPFRSRSCLCSPQSLPPASELSLWTFQQNARARRFYAKHGFVAVVETDGLDNEEKLPDVLYRWRRDAEGA